VYSYIYIYIYIFSYSIPSNPKRAQIPSRGARMGKHWEKHKTEKKHSINLSYHTNALERKHNTENCQSLV